MKPNSHFDKEKMATQNECRIERERDCVCVWVCVCVCVCVRERERERWGNTLVHLFHVFCFVVVARITLIEGNKINWIPAIDTCLVVCFV